MNSTQIQCFMAAAELQNFSKAAERLYITQPALSRNISGLEDELELLLFVRHNNVLALTPGGKMLYEWLRRTGPGFEKLLDSARRANSQTEQALRVGFVKSELPSEKVAKALKLMVDRYPEMEVLFDHFHSGEIIDKLEEHAMDVAIMISSAVRGNPRLVAKKIESMRRCIVVSITHKLAGRGKISLSDCKEEVFISVKPEVSPTLSAMIREVCAEAGFVPMILEADSTEEQLQWIVSNKGIGLLVENHIKRDNPLFSFLKLEEKLPGELVCVWDRLNTNPHIQSLIDAFDE